MFWDKISLDSTFLQAKGTKFVYSSDRCAWLSSAHADYALLVPRPTYADLWEEACHSHGPAAQAARVSVWPAQGKRPDWWSCHWKDSWPWEKDPGDMEVDGQRDEGWKRFGPHGDKRFPGEPLNHLHARSAWIISPNGLMPSDRK